MHYAYVDGKRVSNHLMRDCRTFLRLQEVVGLKQADAQGTIAYDAPPPLPNHGDTATQGQSNMGSQRNVGYTQSKNHIAANDPASAKVKKRAAKHIHTSKYSHNIASSHYGIP
jgi:hypothetical protein